MSFPEYRQQPSDHRSCVILVKAIGSFVSKATYTTVWDQLTKLKRIPVAKYRRNLTVRFVSNYPTENNEWGDFQFHRKVLGLICIAQHNENIAGSDLEAQYSDLKNLYDSSLLDSRLVILGLPRNNTRSVKDVDNYSNTPNGSPRGDSLKIDPNHYDSEGYNDVLPDLLDRCKDGLHDILSDMTDVTRRHTLTYSDAEEAVSYINLDIEYMCQSLFYVLESKKLSMTTVNFKQPTILLAPFEKAAVHHLDMDSKATRNRFTARGRKRIADLCLLLDQPDDAVVHYEGCMELLKATGDDFWVGGVLEGIAVASSILLHQQQQFESSQSTDGDRMKRTSSFNGRTSPGLLLDPSISLHNSFNHLDLASKPKLSVTPDDIIVKYRDAIAYYSKMMPAAIIEMEASLKATRLLIEHKKTKMAAEFLHHVAYVNLDEISYKERVERYDVMGDLYQQLNFHRKASFFKRVAAMHCVNPMLPSPAWSECYHLLLQAFPGFKMSFDPKHYQTPGQTMGWPGIRLRVFHELLFAARQLGNNLVVIRHVALCLHTMFGCMIAKEIVDLVHLLETYTDLQYDDGAEVTTLHNMDLPPVPFTAFPLLSSFSVMKLPTQLEAHKVKLNVPNDSVFIYSPMNLPRKDSTTQLITQYDFYWVQDNPGTVEVHLYNPLPLELNITDFSLLVEGARFQSYPSSHALPPESGPHIINIVGTPSQRGKLKILGYQMSLFGVLSRCLFTELPHLKQNTYIVDIAPVLPSISISSELPKSPYMVTGGDNKIVTSAILQIYVGEERECSIRLKNNSNISVVRIHAELFSDKYQDLVSRFLSVDSGDIESCLPLVPGEETTLKIRTNGALKLTDLPNQALLSPGNNTDTDSNRASSALIESLLKVTYTGAQGDMDKFYRECIMSIDVVVIPSVNILSQSITPVGAESCHVVYEVFNESNMILEIESSDKTISLKPMQSDSSSMDEGLHCKLDKSSSSSSLEECMLTINESVSMSWRSNDKTHHGLVNIDKLEWSDTELDKLRKRPFTVTGSVTKNSCSRFMVGEPIELSYQITNTSGLDYSDIELRFAVYQESASNQTGIEEGLTYIQPGASHYSYPQFDLSELIDLRHSIVMLFAGQYTIECFCYHQGKQIFDIDPGITLMVV